MLQLYECHGNNVASTFYYVRAKWLACYSTWSKVASMPHYVEPEWLAFSRSKRPTLGHGFSFSEVWKWKPKKMDMGYQVDSAYNGYQK